MLSQLKLFKKCFHFTWKGGGGEREEEIERGLHIPNAFNSWCWTKLKSGAEGSIWVSLWVAGTQCMSHHLLPTSPTRAGSISRKLDWK